MSKKTKNNAPVRGVDKFFRNVNMMGNRIINLRVNDPVEPDEPVNKKFAEKTITYDTEKVNRYGRPFTFNWMQNVLNFDFKAVLDDLFFPEINPIYYNPQVEFLDFVLNDYEQQYLGKWLLFNHKNYRFSLKVKFTNFDRDSFELPYLLVDNDGVETSITPTLFINNIATFEIINLKLKQDSLKFKIGRLYGPSNVTKQTTYGNDYIPYDFQVTYLLEKDYLPEFNIFESLMIRNQTVNGKPADIINGNPVPNTFVYTNRFYINSNTDGIIDFLIPENDLHKYVLKIFLYDNSGVKPIFLSVEYIPFDKLFFLGTYKLNKDGVTYLYGQYNYGIFYKNIFGSIKLEHVNTEIFV
jgi:hypothetical protein